MIHSKKSFPSFLWLVVLGVAWVLGFSTLERPLQAQNVRNPVLEFCTGTWCQWCPCGDDVILNQILPVIPNAIVLAYHGPANGSDPFSYFSGNTILSALGFNAYPTGIIDRVSGIQSRGVWLSYMQSRLSVAPTVQIDMNSYSYDPATREFNAIIDFTALQNLSGHYKFNVILVEDGQVYPQTTNSTCSPGQPGVIQNYVHDWIVRDMMNGYLGQDVVNGTWNQGDVITRTITHTIPLPSGGAPDINPDSCEVVVMVYKVGSPLNSNGEIQQAEKWPLITPNFLAQISSPQSDHLGANTETVTTTVVIHNIGLMTDTYALDLTVTGPVGWDRTYTTVNGTFPPGHTDTLSVAPGDSTVIEITVSANGITGYGEATLHYASVNSPANAGELRSRFATFGLDVLLVDGEPENYESYLIRELDTLGVNYGVVGSSVVPQVSASDLSSFNMLLWMTALAEPSLTPEEMDAIAAYLDRGGNLYLNGVDIAYYLADPASPYYTTQSYEFFTNYLHATYHTRNYTFLMVEGINGDPISGGINRMGLTGGTGASTINFQTGRYANQISPADTNGAPIFHYYSRPNDFCAIRAIHYGTQGNGKVVFSTFGFETIAEDTNRTLLAQRVIDWLNTPVGIGEDQPGQLAYQFELKQNYPNPFNPTTQITYTVPAGYRHVPVQLVIYNQLGQQVRTLVNAPRQPGRYTVTWDGRDDAGNRVSSGIYFYRLQIGDLRAVRKMALIR
ncbi:MAG: T9SS C-terminal target domain-containing protein [Calditrichaeota bacterium]|nr:MAG: T9SS C-terminal target domain-containing protein [Calditrichota bacterium]